MSDFPESSPITRQSIAPPTCKVASSYAGKGRPEKKMAAAAASFTDAVSSNSFRYAETKAVFSSFLVVLAMASAVSAKRRIVHWILRASKANATIAATQKCENKQRVKALKYKEIGIAERFGYGLESRFSVVL